MRIAYFDCFSGISGDMTVGAFLDAGLSMRVLSKELARLKVGGYELAARKVKRGEIAATKFDVTVKGRGHIHRPLKDILAMIGASGLNKNVKRTAAGIFEVIGKAEAKVHGVGDTAGVSFHELGHIDSIIDIVGAAIALDELGIEKACASAVTLGRTLTESGHGILPIPGPASLEMLKGVPVRISEIGSELVTPTGAGILKSVCKSFGEAPRMAVSSIGYGAGSRDLKEMPNMLRVVIGENEESFKEDTIIVVEANIDDMSPVAFEHLFDLLFSEGALDAYVTSIYMKKTRPGFKLTVLTPEALLKKICRAIFKETPTIGVRYYAARRFKLDRKVVKAKTPYGDVAVKVSVGPGGILTVSPEYESCSRIAKEKKISFKEVYESARTAARA
ncbi:MAG: nickel pincer cofactor biosynthesis protein LarC [Candidatus Omnitrophica bacterium]|nr:nickel pincer cofactor biosynthesis protein LarC [Candidatus Omnitrophota bacterium]